MLEASISFAQESYEQMVAHLAYLERENFNQTARYDQRTFSTEEPETIIASAATYIEHMQDILHTVTTSFLVGQSITGNGQEELTLSKAQQTPDWVDDLELIYQARKNCMQEIADAYAQFETEFMQFTAEYTHFQQLPASQPLYADTDFVAAVTTKVTTMEETVAGCKQMLQKEWPRELPFRNDAHFRAFSIAAHGLLSEDILPCMQRYRTHTERILKSLLQKEIYSNKATEFEYELKDYEERAEREENKMKEHVEAFHGLASEESLNALYETLQPEPDDRAA